jgi:sepiapterin reductase
MTKLLVITGASRGLGRSIALAFVRQFCPSVATAPEMWKICLLARNQPALLVTRQMIHETLSSNQNVTVDCHGIDLSQMDDLSDRIESILVELSSESVSELYFINNGGSLGPIGPCRKTNLQEMRTNFDLNITSACWLSARFVQWAKETMQCPKTVVVNISSLVAIQAFPSLGMYSAGKAARDMFHAALSQEEENVLVLNYAPGPLETDMTEQIRQAPLLDTSLRPHYQKQLVDSDDSAAKLVDVLFHQKFKSGQHLDYYDVIE